MKNNKAVIYIGILVVGVLLGWVFFGGSSSNEAAHQHDEVTETSEMWTCSMHPQIMQPEPGDCPICGMDLIPAATSGEGLALNQIKMTANAMALANIATSVVGTAGTENSAAIMTLSGKIATNKENNAIQASYFDGRLEQLNVNYEGQEIHKGQLLATIYSPNLVAAQQELITAATLKNSQPDLYRAVRNKLKLLKLSENQIRTIETSGKVRDNFPVYATISGTVSSVMVAEGDYVKQGQPIVKANNLNSVWAEFDVYENQISQLQKGQKIKVTTSAYPNKEFDAIISFIDPILNIQSRTVTVRTVVNNTDNLFKPGMFVTGKIKGMTMSNTNELYIPSSAVLWTGERSLVYVKTNPNEPIFEMREVTIGNRNGENIRVVSGLENGEYVVTKGTFTVDAAAQLQGKKSMMNKRGGTTTTGHEGHTGLQAATANKMESTSMKMEFPKTFEKNFTKVIASYLPLKDAFVASEGSKISILAKEAVKIFNAMPSKELGKMEKAHWNKSIEMLTNIAATENLVAQRAHFVLLNENLVAIAQHIKSDASKLYVQQCPMANSNKGAVWLSSEKKVKNPYYGEAMLTCGSVVDEIN